VRAAYVRADPDASARDRGLAEAVGALDHRARPVRATVAAQEVEVVPGPALRRRQHDPAALRIGLHREESFLGEALAEDEGVAARVGAETVIADPAVVVLVAGWDAAGRRMDRVVEAIAGPGDASALGERDPVGEGLSARDVEDMKGGHFGAATRQAVRDESPVGRRVPPVEGDE